MSQHHKLVPANNETNLKQTGPKYESHRRANNATTSPESQDLRAEIARCAYEIWLNEGAGHGRDLDHWLRAERELAERPRKPSAGHAISAASAKNF